MRILLSILLIISPILGHAQLSTNNKVAAFNRTEGAVVYENYALNQSFDKNLVGVSTPTGGTASIVTTSGVKLFGKGSLQFAVTSTGQLTAIRSKPFPIGLNGQTCQTKFTYATPYGGAVTQREFSYFVTNSSGTKISATATLPATFNIAGTQQSKTAVVFYPCPYNSVTPANSWVELTIEHIGSASTSIIIDEKFDMVANDIGAGVPNNVFSAKVSSAGVVSDENEDFISGNCAVASGTQTCTFVSGKFNIAPNCTYSINASGVSGLASNATTSTTSLAFTSFGSSTGTPNAASFNIVCTRAGTDFIQPTITPNQWNYGRTAYTPTFTGFGTVSNIECYHDRKGEYLNIDCKFTGGTPTATEARISLPNSLVIQTFTQGIRQCGGDPKFSGTGAADVSVLCESGLGYMTFGYQTPTTAGLTKINGSSLLSSGTAMSFKATIPIKGWTENQNAPQLLGSLTSDSVNALRDEWLVSSCASTSTISSTSTTGWATVGNYSGNTTTSSCAITFTKPFSAVPACTITEGQAPSNRIVGPGSITASGLNYACYSANTNCANGAIFVLKCTGPR